MGLAPVYLAINPRFLREWMVYGTVERGMSHGGRNRGCVGCLGKVENEARV